MKTKLIAFVFLAFFLSCSNNDESLIKLATIESDESVQGLIQEIEQKNAWQGYDYNYIHILYIKMDSVKTLYKNLIMYIDTTEDIDLVRAAFITFHAKINSFYDYREYHNYRIDTLDELKLSTKELIKLAASLKCKNILKEFALHTRMPNCACCNYKMYSIYPKTDTIKLSKQFLGFLTLEYNWENGSLDNLLKNSYKVISVRRDGKKVDDVFISISPKTRTLVAKPAQKGHYDIEMLFSARQRDSSIIDEPLNIEFEVTD